MRCSWKACEHAPFHKDATFACVRATCHHPHGKELIISSERLELCVSTDDSFR